MSANARDPAALLNMLEGNWTPVYQEIDGQMLPAAANDLALELQNSEFTIEKNGEVVYEGTYTIEGATSPLSISFTYKKSAQPLFLGEPRPGVFQVEGDTLKMCFGTIGQARPAALTTHPGSECILSIFRRASAMVQIAALSKSNLRSLIAW